MQTKNILQQLAEHPAGTFLEITSFNETSIGACDITGVSPVWEMHPDTDEMFLVLEGELEVTLLAPEVGAGDRTHHKIATGSVMVVPKGYWHKPAAPGGVKFVYLTPGSTLHSDKDDPRQS